MGNILVTDDSLIQLIILEQTLFKNGHRVYKAENGHDALIVLNKNNIDILITDIFMPKIDGIELITKTRDLNINIGIIAISGGGDVIKDFSYLKYAKELGADFSLTKPVDEQYLLKAIGYILNP